MPYFVVEKTVSVEHLRESQMTLGIHSCYSGYLLLDYAPLAAGLHDDSSPATSFDIPSDNHTGGFSATVYKDRSTAYANLPDTHTHHVLFVITDAERCLWQNRERNRFRLGEYAPVPWSHLEIRVPRFPHLSVKQKGMIAFTADDEAGYQDRQTVMKPGRYIETYLSDVIPASDVAHYIAECVQDAHELKFAVTADEIEAVYTNGPSSCMSHKVDHFESSIHPVRVYGDSDLQVAYIGSPNTRVSARCVVWPEKKRYSRIYGSEELMLRLLRAAGYESGSLRNARVRRIFDERGQLVMPYVDGISSAAVKGEWIVLGVAGDVQTNSITGVPECEEDNTRACDRCDRRYDPENEGGPDYCAHCEDRMVSCQACETYFFPDDQGAETANGHVCDHCYHREHHECEVCNEEFFTCDFSRREVARRTGRGSHERLCADCDSLHVICEECDTFYDTDNEHCPDCETAPLTPRCEHTADLLAPVVETLVSDATPETVTVAMGAADESPF